MPVRIETSHPPGYLDELIRSSSGARDHLVGLEDMSDDELDRLREEFEALKHRRSAR